MSGQAISVISLALLPLAKPSSVPGARKAAKSLWVRTMGPWSQNNCNYIMHFKVLHYCTLKFDVKCVVQIPKSSLNFKDTIGVFTPPILGVMWYWWRIGYDVTRKGVVSVTVDGTTGSLRVTLILCLGSPSLGLAPCSRGQGQWCFVFNFITKKKKKQEQLAPT